MSSPVTAATKRTRARGRPTATANFGSGRRESHDASGFYGRFTPPVVSADDTIGKTARLDVIHPTDARTMTDVADDSVALVVTSPPYFAGKQYEEALGVDGVPADYFEYLDMLGAVFTECARVLEPGGRIAVNVANLGRRPFRSLAGDVTEILSGLGLLLRGEVVWWKGRAAGGSCAWGTFQSPGNPVLRDVTERIVIASKGRFERALTPTERTRLGLPSVATISRDEFMEATTDLWELPPESARRIGHPAPFPVSLPQRLIELFTYAEDVVLDPFMGSGSTAVAAVRTGRHFIGFDTDTDYVEAANARITSERERLESPGRNPSRGGSGEVADADPIADAVAAGLQASDVAKVLVESCGFTDVRNDVKPRGLGITLDLVATDGHGRDWAFDVTGAFTTTTSGLRHGDTLWRSLATAAVLHTARDRDGDDTLPLVLITTHRPVRNSAGHKALAALTDAHLGPVVDVIELLDPDDRARLVGHAVDGLVDTPPAGT